MQFPSNLGRPGSTPLLLEDEKRSFGVPDSSSTKRQWAQSAPNTFGSICDRVGIPARANVCHTAWIRMMTRRSSGKFVTTFPSAHERAPDEDCTNSLKGYLATRVPKPGVGSLSACGSLGRPERLGRRFKPARQPATGGKAPVADCHTRLRHNGTDGHSEKSSTAIAKLSASGWSLPARPHRDRLCLPQEA